MVVGWFFFALGLVIRTDAYLIVAYTILCMGSGVTPFIFSHWGIFLDVWKVSLTNAKGFWLCEKYLWPMPRVSGCVKSVFDQCQGFLVVWKVFLICQGFLVMWKVYLTNAGGFWMCEQYRWPMTFVSGCVKRNVHQWQGFLVVWTISLTNAMGFWLCEIVIGLYMGGSGR